MRSRSSSRSAWSPGAGAVAYGYTTTKLPNPNKDFETSTTFVYWGDGKSELGDFAIQNRQPLDFDEMPDTIKQAVVAAENRTFWTDKGVSLRRHGAVGVRHRPGRQPAGRLDDHPAVHQDPLPQQRADGQPQVPRAVPRLQAEPAEEQSRRSCRATSTPSTSGTARTGSRPRARRTSRSTPRS